MCGACCYDRAGSLPPREVSQGRDGILGTASSHGSKPVFSREKHRVVSVAVALPSVLSPFKELIAVKITEIYNALRSG